MKKAQHDAMTTDGFRSWIAADRKRLFMFYMCLLLLLLAISAGLYVAGRRIELGAAPLEAPRGNLAERFKEAYTVEYNGLRYRYRNNLVSVLFMGIDRPTEENAAASGFRTGGQADFLLLMVIDPTEKRITTIQIDRDTMAEITILGVLGNPAGTRTAQICLSHGFGDGGAQSCLFTVDAVSKCLLGVDIDFYVALNLDGIEALNEALGGVTVTLADDFTVLDPTMRAGETLTLRGKQAEYYVRSRMNIGEGTNAARMARQKDFLSKAGVLLDEKLRRNVNFIGTLFDALSKNLTTDMPRGRMINEANASRNYSRVERTPDGEHMVGPDGFVEFHADAQSLEALVLDVFYEPANAP